MNFSNSILRTLAIGTIAVSLFSAPAVATTIPDSDDFVSPDILSLTATHDATYLYLSGTFDVGFNPSNVGLLLGIDTDLNLATGAGNSGQYFPVGAEYSITYVSTALDEPGRFRLSRWVTPDTTEYVGYLTPQFGGNEFVLAIPLSVIGDDGIVNFGLAAGNPTVDRNFTPTDFVSGTAPFVTLVGPSDFGTPLWSYDPKFTPVLRTVVVTTAEDELDTPTGALTSLREAIRDNADIITFAPGLNGGTITLDAAQGEIVLGRDVTIDASGLSDGLTISGDNASRIFTVSSGETVALNNLTLTGGNGTGASLTNNGGAIFNNGTLTLTQCTLSGNTAVSDDLVYPSGFGGAILNRGPLALTQCTLSGNSATYGGAIINDLVAIATLTLTQCTLANNSAVDGGAILNFRPLTVTQCSFSGNHADTNGGAIHNVVNTLTLNNSIVSGNTAASGADIRNQTTLTREGANIVQSLTNVGGTENGTGTIINAQAHLSTLANYGGPTQTMLPLPGSPAIDGVPAGSEVAGLTTDQRGTGFARVLDGDGNGSVFADIGAVELRGFIIVTTAADELDTPTGTQTSLREAIRDNAAATVPADVISFASGLNGGTIALDAAKGEIVLDRDVAIDATSLPGGITVVGENTNFRVFQVGTVTVALTGFTVSGGRGDQGGALLNDGNLTLTRMIFTGNTATGNGGAIFNNHGGGRRITATDCLFTGNTVAGGGAGGAIFNYTGAALTLNDCSVSGNSTDATSGGSGGGLRNLGGTMVLNGCTFSGNTARTNGGGISNIAAEAGTAANVTLSGCTLAGNTATTIAGGGIHNEFQLGTAATVALKRSTLSGNSAGAFGGAIFNVDGSTLALTQCTLSGNSAGYGGALYNRGALTLAHCTLSGNLAPGEGGAIVNWVGTLTLTNSIVAGSLAPSPEDIYNSPLGPTITFIGANIVQSLTNNGFLNGSGTISNAAPLLAPLGNYGGSTQSMALLRGSPARDAAIGSLITSDQRGFPIVGTPDIGAYEAGTTNTFALWAIENVGSAVSFTADSENDGNKNGLEYATRTDPLAANANPFGQPALIAGPAYQFTFPYRPGATDLRYIVYRSPDLTNWTEIYRNDLPTGGVSEFGAVTGVENGTAQTITITDHDFLTPDCFWKLVVEKP